MSETKKDPKVVGLPKPTPQPTEGDRDAEVIPFERPAKPARRRCEADGCDRPHQARGWCMRHYHVWRRTNGINADLPCTKCAVNKRYGGHSWCRECNYAPARARFAARYNSDPAFYSAQRIRNLATNYNLKAEVLGGYGGCCACCGESEFSMLQLDHVNGSGNEERRAYSGWWQGVYRRAKREGFPPDLQCLCANCNASKAAMGRCAHQGGEVNYPTA